MLETLWATDIDPSKILRKPYSKMMQKSQRRIEAQYSSMRAGLTCEKMFNQKRRRKKLHFGRVLLYLVGFVPEKMKSSLNSLMITNRTEVEIFDGVNLNIRDGETQ